MNKLKYISAVLSVLMAFSFTGCESLKEEPIIEEEPVIISPESIVMDWQHPYEEKIKEFMKGENYSADEGNGSMFDITDITGDDIPELIISPNVESKCEIFTLSGTVITSLGTFGENGTIAYLPEKKLIHDETIGTGFVVGKYLAFDETENCIAPLITYYDNTASASQGAKIVHEINGEQLSLPDYDAALDEYKTDETVSLGRKYTFGEDSIKYAVHYSESWGDVLNDQQKESCKNTLLSAVEEAEASKTNAAFEFCDLNADDIPELIVSEGNFNAASCKIFYFSGNELVALEGNYGEDGRLFMDVHERVFYSKGASGITYWSLMETQFTAEEYVSSGNIMEFGRKNLLSRHNIFKALKLEDNGETAADETAEGVTAEGASESESEESEENGEV